MKTRIQVTSLFREYPPFYSYHAAAHLNGGPGVVEVSLRNNCEAECSERGGSCPGSRTWIGGQEQAPPPSRAASSANELITLPASLPALLELFDPTLMHRFRCAWVSFMSYPTLRLLDHKSYLHVSRGLGCVANRSKSRWSGYRVAISSGTTPWEIRSKRTFEMIPCHRSCWSKSCSPTSIVGTEHLEASDEASTAAIQHSSPRIS